MKAFIVFFCLISSCSSLNAQGGNDVTAPLHAMKPDYPMAYGVPASLSVKSVLDRVYHYLDSVTPMQFVNKSTGKIVSLAEIDTFTILQPGDFRLTSYEWGVT